MRPRFALVLLVAAALPALAARAADPAVARPRVGDQVLSGATVFFLETPSGAAGVGAAHSFDLDRIAAATEVVFQRGKSKTVVARASGFLAPPGTSFSAPGGSIRGDFLLFALDAPPRDVRVLRAGKPAKAGERVALLGVPRTLPHDEDDLFGRVTATDAERLEVDLDVWHDLRGWGGAPIVSRDDQRVVGVLQAAAPSGGTLRIIAAPIAAVVEAAAHPLDGKGRPFGRFAAADASASAKAAAAQPTPGRTTLEAKPQASGKATRDAAPATAEPEAVGSFEKPREPTRITPVVTQELVVEVEQPIDESIVSDELGAFVAGRALAPTTSFQTIDVVLVLDVSLSTLQASGLDVNGNGVVGKSGPGGLGSLFGIGPSDAGDTILAAEVEAARKLMERLDARSTRVGIVTFSGETDPQGFGRAVGVAAVTDAALSSDYAAVRRALDRILERGPNGGTHIAAGVDQGIIELAGLRGAWSKRAPNSQRIMILITDDEPTLPFPGDDRGNVRAVIRAAQRARKAGIRVYTVGVGKQAIENPLAILDSAETTGGDFVPATDMTRLLSLVDHVSFVEIRELTVRNLTTEQPAHAVQLGPDGSFGALVPLAAGRNEIEVRAVADDGREETARVHVVHAPGAPPVKLPETLVALRNRLLEERLVQIKRVRIDAEQTQLEKTRKDEVQIEDERARARERAAAQRKELDLRVEERESEDHEPAPGSPLGAGGAR